MLRKCPWYFDLLDIFQDRASVKPKMTSDELDSDEEDDVTPSDDDDSDNDDNDDDSNGNDDTDLVATMKSV